MLVLEMVICIVIIKIISIFCKIKVKSKLATNVYDEV